MAEELDLETLNAAFRDIVPHNKALGLELVGASHAPAVAVMKMPWDERFVGNPQTRVLHGGVITTMLDACGGASVFFKLMAPTPIATLDLRIDYLKPAAPEKPVFARAECYHASHNVAFVRATAYQDGEDDCVATATATYMLSTKGKSVTEHDAVVMAKAAKGGA